MNFDLAQLGTALIGLAATIGATIAVCLGNIDSATYIAIIGPLAGVGVGAGIHSAGTSTGVKAVTNGATTMSHEVQQASHPGP